MSSRMVHFDPDIFPEPHAFKPERWLEDTATAGAQPLDYWLVAFGKGPRSCLAPKYVICRTFPEALDTQESNVRQFGVV